MSGNRTGARVILGLVALVFLFPASIVFLFGLLFWGDELDKTARTTGTIAALVAGLAGAWGAAVQVVLWPTLVFAILERSTDRDAVDVLAWDPDQLPDATLRQRGISLGEAVTGATFSLVVAALLVLQHELTWIGPDSRTALLDPDLWSGWLPSLVVVLVAGAALELWKYRVGWTMSVLAATVVTSASSVRSA